MAETRSIVVSEGTYGEFTMSVNHRVPILKVSVRDIVQGNPRGPADSASKVIQQLAAWPSSESSELVEATASKAKENHASTTIIERISKARREYLAWLSLRTAAITGKDPAIDSEAEASWHAR
jgi:hypothetical protein